MTDLLAVNRRGGLRRQIRRVRRAAFTPVATSRSTAIGHSERLSALTAGTSSLEYLTRRRDIEPGGINDWTIHRGTFRNTHPAVQAVLDTIGRRSVTTALHQGRVVAAAALLAPGTARWRGVADIYLGVSSALLYPRHRYGTDGSDQVTVVVQTATGVARLARTSSVADAMLWYVSLQAGLSYGVSGWMKLLGASWRDGTALRGVMRTTTYGHSSVWRVAENHPRAARAFVHGVLAFECLFPVVYLARGRLTRVALLGANAFHIGNGVFMGLGRFVTSFASMHPALAYTTTPRALLTDKRDDTVLRTVAHGGLLAMAGAAAMGVGRRMQSSATWPQSRQIVARSGNRLSYDTSFDDARSARPVVVFEPGLLATPELLSWNIETLVSQGTHDLVSYYRAGYGPSTRESTAPYRLDESVDDLLDLIDAAVGRERHVVLVGHSLGGEICRRAAHRLPGRVDGVIYLDSAHPGELNRSHVQRETGEVLRRNLALMSTGLRFGLGALLTKPEWIDDLPVAYRRKAFAHYTDSRMWSTAAREWAATTDEFLAHPGTVPPLDTHSLVISADATVENDAEHRAMHHELADSHRGADRVVCEHIIDGSEHSSLVTDPYYAHQVSAHITDFLTSIGCGVRHG